jgi:membrane-associated phospholipid phosphatase
MYVQPMAPVAEPTGPPQLPRFSLLGSRARLPVLGFIAAAIGVTVWLGIVDYHDKWANDWDLRMSYRLSHRFAGHLGLMKHIADLGGQLPVVVFSTAIVALAAVWRRPRAIALAVGAPLLAVLLTEGIVKPWVHRAPFGVDTYPSGHSTGIFAVTTVLAIVLIGPSAPRRWAPLRWVIAYLALLVACAVAVALVAAGFHFATDVIGGACIGALTACLLALAIDGVVTLWHGRF